MEGVIWIGVAVFVLGYWLGRRKTASRRTSPSRLPPQPKPGGLPRKFCHSRWEEKDELFWNMLRMGVSLRPKRQGYLLSETENRYRDQLETWFGRYCEIHSQVSLGQLIAMPEQGGFSLEERKRFFAIFNGMAMDFVLVSRKTGKIVCVLELNDASHLQDVRQERDAKLEALMARCGIPFLAVPVSAMDEKPDIWAVREKVCAG